MRELQQLYESGETKPLEDLWRAWKAIQELPPDDLQSFFNIGGYHGEPFVGPDSSSTYWGGFCNHGNVLFPTWHRAYVIKLEEALQRFEPDVVMPYWDETSDESVQHGIPWPLTREKIVLDGEPIDNPLRSFVLPVEVIDNTVGQTNQYTKPAGYETVRYPQSGLVGTAGARAKTAEQNATYHDAATNADILNGNVSDWLSGSYEPDHDLGTAQQYHACISAPNYTAFSNTTSAGAWNKHHPGYVVPLEEPHNHIHLAIGGFDVKGQGDFDRIDDANGDMGENNTAGLDPIFFFHHCFVDRVFWAWQVANDATDDFDIIAGFAGADTATSDQGYAAGQYQNEPLTMDTELKPFRHGLDNSGECYTSRDCINIETQLGYTYSPGSLGATIMAAASSSPRKLVVSGINRALFKGSFVVKAFAKVDGVERSIGRQAVLSRWNTEYCANCQTHIEVVATFPLSALADSDVDRAEFRIEIDHRGVEGSLPDAVAPRFEVRD